MRSADSDTFGVLALADIDNFRRMNHVIGHVAADRILAEVARRVQGAGARRAGRARGRRRVRALRPGPSQRRRGRRRWRQRLATALTFEHAGVSVRVAVGYAIFPRDANGVESLLMAADSSLADAKAQADRPVRRGPRRAFSRIGADCASSERITGAALVTVAAVAFSAKAVIIKLAYRHGVDPVTLLTLRMLISAPFFLALGLWAARGADVAAAHGARLARRGACWG